MVREHAKLGTISPRDKLRAEPLIELVEGEVGVGEVPAFEDVGDQLRSRGVSPSPSEHGLGRWDSARLAQTTEERGQRRFVLL